MAKQIRKEARVAKFQDEYPKISFWELCVWIIPFKITAKKAYIIEFEPKSDMNSFEIHGKVRYFTTSNWLKLVICWILVCHIVNTIVDMMV